MFQEWRSIDCSSLQLNHLFFVLLQRHSAQSWCKEKGKAKRRFNPAAKNVRERDEGEEEGGAI